MKKWIWCSLILCILVLPSESFAMRVVIDPGHGGKDSGAVGVNGLYEKVVNLDVSLKLKKELEKRGISVYLTRNDDTYLTLQERAVFADEQYGDIFISIHSNSFPNNRSVKGTLILYYDANYPQKSYPASEAMTALSPQSRQFAKTVSTTLVNKVQTSDQGIRPSAVYVVRNGQIPSILVELAFLSNPSDAARLAREQFRLKAAIGIADGIKDYLQHLDSEAKQHWAYKHIASLTDKKIIDRNRYYLFPNKPLTRAEFFVYMDRLKKYIAESASQPNPADSEEPFEEGLTEEESIDEGQAIEEPSDEGPGNEEPSEVTKYDEEQSVSRNSNLESTIVSTSKAASEAASEATQGKASDAISDIQFSDLPTDHWAYQTIMEAVKAGYILGYEDGTVRPERAVSRAEMVTIFDRMFFPEEKIDLVFKEEVEQVESPNPFDDVTSDKWYYHSINKLKNTSIVFGVTEHRFEPNRLIRRGEGLAIMDRYLLNLFDKK